MDPLKVVTWNINSLKARAALVARFLDQENPDILCLQELKLPDEQVPRQLFEARGYQLAVHGQPTWNGVLIASRQPLEFLQSGLPEGDEGQARFQVVKVAGLRLVNLYCPQGQSVDSPKFLYKLSFYDALLDWLGQGGRRPDPLLLTGDLNIAPEARDIWDPEAWAGVPTFHPEEHKRWRALLALGLTDVVREHVPAQSYTFWDYRSAAFRFNHGMRIDHFLASPEVTTRVQGARILRDWRKKPSTAPKAAAGEGLKPSDHAPVEILLRAV